MIHLKIEQTDGKPVIHLDEADLAKLGASVGDTVAVESTAIERQAGESETERQLRIARTIMVDYRETLEELAK